MGNTTAKCPKCGAESDYGRFETKGTNKTRAGWIEWIDCNSCHMMFGKYTSAKQWKIIERREIYYDDGNECERVIS